MSTSTNVCVSVPPTVICESLFFAPSNFQGASVNTSSLRTTDIPQYSRHNSWQGTNLIGSGVEVQMVLYSVVSSTFLWTGGESRS